MGDEAWGNAQSERHFLMPSASCPMPFYRDSMVRETRRWRGGIGDRGVTE